MGRMIHTILFNDKILFDTQQGAAFYNATTEAFAILSYSESQIPARMISYHVHWAIDPQPGEQIEWRYDGYGNYKSAAKVPMRPQQLMMVNCADIKCEEEKVRVNKR